MAYLISQNGWYLIGVNKGDTVQNTVATLVNSSLYDFVITNAYCVNNNYFGNSSPSPGNFTVSEWKELKTSLNTNLPYSLGVWVNIILSSPQVVTPSQPDVEPTAGKVVDGYVSGSKVMQGLTIIDNETNSLGVFNTTNITYNKSVITAIGGTYIDTGFYNNLTLKAIAKTGSVIFIISPLTTLAASLVQSNAYYIDTADNYIANRLGITKDDINKDPIELLSNNNDIRLLEICYINCNRTVYRNRI